jgi:hypothetical protein
LRFTPPSDSQPFPEPGKGHFQLKGGDWMGAIPTDTTILVDIRTVSVDKALSRDARIAEFIRQIKNPYRFKCGKFTVTAKYADSGLTLEDCLMQMIS